MERLEVSTLQTTLDTGNESEIGELLTILMHRPGDEFRRLRHDNLDELLFDALPNVDQSQQSHDAFTGYLRDHGVQVLYVQHLLLATLIHSQQARLSLIDGIVAHTLFGTDPNEALTLAALRQWLSQRTPQELANDAIHGVACSEDELGTSASAHTLIDHCQFKHEFVVPPLPNLFYTRDAFSMIEKKVFIWQMAKAARQNEPLILRVIFQYHPQLSTSGLEIVEWQNHVDEHDLATIEGGDVAYLGNGDLMIGCSERTNRVAIEALARTGVFHRVIVVMLPPQRDYMHLDTVLSCVGKRAFTLHGRLTDTMHVFTVQVHDDNNNLLPKPEWILHGQNVCDALRKVLNNPQLMFYDATDGETSIVEQREARHNVLALADGHVVTYGGGDAEKGVVAGLRKNGGFRVGVIPTEGLLAGAGGVHCLTNALRRRLCTF